MLDESDDELERALLRSVRGDALPDGSRRRILAGLGIAGAVATTTSTAASSLVAGKAGLFKGTSAVVAKWVAVSAVVGLGSTGVIVARSHLHARDLARSSAPASAPAPEPRAAVRDQAPPTPAAANEVVNEPAPVATVAPRENRVSAPAAPKLSEELAAIQVARTALASHDPAAALAALDRYKARFPAGRLAPEATVLRIDALVERGDRAEAAALAERFEASNPRSPYAGRIRSILSRSKGQAIEPGTR
jgi:hypothetical protein